MSFRRVCPPNMSSGFRSIWCWSTGTLSQLQGQAANGRFNQAKCVVIQSGFYFLVILLLDAAKDFGYDFEMIFWEVKGLLLTNNKKMLTSVLMEALWMLPYARLLVCGAAFNQDWPRHLLTSRGLSFSTQTFWEFSLNSEFKLYLENSLC